MSPADYLNSQEDIALERLRDCQMSAYAMMELYKEFHLTDDAHNWSAVVCLLEQAIKRFA